MITSMMIDKITLVLDSQRQNLLSRAEKPSEEVGRIDNSMSAIDYS